MSNNNVSCCCNDSRCYRWMLLLRLRLLLPSSQPTIELSMSFFFHYAHLELCNWHHTTKNLGLYFKFNCMCRLTHTHTYTHCISVHPCALRTHLWLSTNKQKKQRPTLSLSLAVPFKFQLQQFTKWFGFFSLCHLLFVLIIGFINDITN